MAEKALGIIDAQRGFMPADEGERLQAIGFGELPVKDGEQIVAPTNRLLAAYAQLGHAIFTTQDWHPEQTAHFSDEPNFTTTWPRHCVAGTAGASLHPDIHEPENSIRFIKGFEALTRGEDDTSYSGYYAKDQFTGISLPEWLQRRNVSQVLLGGLALDYCVKETALDLRRKLGLEVVVAIDATRGIADLSVANTLTEFRQYGVETTTTDEWLADLKAV